jgi:hypothetical protein
MHQLKPYVIDLSIVFTATATKMYALVTGLSFGINAIDIFGKCLYVLVMLITGFTTVYRFVKEIKADKDKAKEVSGKVDESIKK